MIGAWIRAAAGGVLDLVCPPRCLVCGDFFGPEPDRDGVCAGCRGDMPPLPDAHCSICGTPFQTTLPTQHPCGQCRRKRPHYDRALAAGLYEDSLRKAVHEFKYRNRTELAGPLGRMLAQSLPQDFRPPEIDMVLPVPLHRKRLRSRGFNQALLLARAAYGERSGVICWDLLLRTRFTAPQVDLSGEARRANVRRAFSVSRPDDVKGRTAVVLDDVYTTGATVSECARTLKKAGADRVLVLTLARVG